MPGGTARKILSLVTDDFQHAVQMFWLPSEVDLSGSPRAWVFVYANGMWTSGAPCTSFSFAADDSSASFTLSTVWASAVGEGMEQVDLITKVCEIGVQSAKQASGSFVIDGTTYQGTDLIGTTVEHFKC